jgi:hypothetical protein
MPGGVGAVFYSLWQTAVFLEAIREFLADLYGSQENVDLLNYTSPFLFVAVKESMQRELLMTLARLSDPAESGSKGRANLSVNRLFHEIESVDKAFAAEIRPAVEAITANCERIRTLRNKTLAHTDLSVALETGGTLLPSVTRADAEGLVDQILELLNVVELHYREATTIFKQSIATGDAESLLHALRQSRACHDRERES